MQFPLKTKEDILKIIQEDNWMMEVLRAVHSLNLPDCWVGGGFIRSKVWDYLHEYPTRTPLPDVDVVYFDTSDFSENEVNSQSTQNEEKYENKLRTMIPDVMWSVTNQARMHAYHNREPYLDTNDAMKDWVETATCVGARIDQDGQLQFLAPWGIEDLTQCILRPAFQEQKRMEEFNRRISSKNWLTKWPKLTVAK